MIFLNYDDLKRISYFITKCRKVINSFHELWKYITQVDNLLNHFCLFWLTDLSKNHWMMLICSSIFPRHNEFVLHVGHKYIYPCHLSGSVICGLLNAVLLLNGLCVSTVLRDLGGWGLFFDSLGCSMVIQDPSLLVAVTT